MSQSPKTGGRNARKMVPFSYCSPASATCDCPSSL